MKNNNFLLQHLLEESAVKYGSRVAIKANGSSITYKGLQEKSNRLANLLVESGLKPKNVAGIYMHKAIEAVAAMFAVLKAGAAYIPLDSHYSPVSRIKKIIELSEAEYIITTVSQWKELSESNGLQAEEGIVHKNIIFIDNLMDNADISFIPENKDFNKFFLYNDNICSEPINAVNIISEDLAYVLYTSGSTGIPKGVMISHINALTFINWSLTCFNPNYKDIFSNFAPLHFDLSVFDIFVSIACGACVSMVPVNIMNNPRAIVEWATLEKITFWYSVPSVWVSIINYSGIYDKNLKHLRFILFAGEVFPPKYLKKLMSLLPTASYFNLYGPTETNVCMYYQVKDANEVSDRPVPIGKVCENTEMLVLNEKDEPVSDEEEGELLIRGAIVTKGYYKDPERSINVFRKSPLEIHNGLMFYKTSDIVKRRSDNCYEYIGRKDLMVKCSGFRIELQEIEHAFYQNDNIEEAVVIPFADNDTNTTKLYAFVKVKEGVQLPIIETKKSLSKILPKYMIPDFIVSIDSIPKNSNRKADRIALSNFVKNKYS